MFSKEQFINSIEHEVRVCKHLFTKLPEGSYDYRPSPEQRSTTELLRYLAMVAIGPARACLEGSWEIGRHYSEKVADMAPEDFPAAMDSQLEDLRLALADVTEERLGTEPVTFLGGPPVMLGSALVNASLKFIAAYRMQLFLYAKAAGAHEIGTSDCWAGVERQPKPPVEEVVESAE